MHTVLSIQRKQNLKDWLLLLKSVIVLLIYYFWLHFHAGKCQLLQCIFQTENADKALKYRLYRHLPAYEKIIRNLVSFFNKYLNQNNNPALFDIDPSNLQMSLVHLMVYTVPDLPYKFYP